MVRVRQTAVISFAVLATVAVLAGVAWACTPQAYVPPIQPEAGAPGSAVTVRGENFDSAQVEIRWNTRNGAMLGTAVGPNFTTTVRIPEVAPGVYYIVAIGRSAADSREIAGYNLAPVTVTRPASSPDPTPDPVAPAPGSTAPSAGQPGVAAPSPSGKPSAASPAATAPLASPVGTDPAPVGPEAASDTAAGAPSAAPATASGTGVRTALTARVPARVAVAGDPRREIREAPTPTPANATAAPVADLAAGGQSSPQPAADLWSGFADDQPGPGLTDGTSTGPRQGSGPFQAGLILVTVILFAGAAVAATGRRKAKAKVSR